MELFTFDKLPEAIREIYEKLDRIEQLMITLQPEKDDDCEVLNVQEAAEFLKITVPAIYTKVSRREIPVSKPGRRLYFQKSALKEWIKQSKLKTRDELQAEAIEKMKGYRKRFGQ